MCIRDSLTLARLIIEPVAERSDAREELLALLVNVAHPLDECGPGVQHELPDALSSLMDIGPNVRPLAGVGLQVRLRAPTEPLLQLQVQDRQALCLRGVLNDLERV